MLAQLTRTAVYGPVRTVVWQGSAGDRGPYADQIPITLINKFRKFPKNCPRKGKFVKTHPAVRLLRSSLAVPSLRPLRRSMALRQRFRWRERSAESQVPAPGWP